MFTKSCKSLISRSHQGTSQSFSTSTSFNLGAHLPRVFGIRDAYIQKETDNFVASDPILSKLNRKEAVRVTVTGAAGQIGYSLIYRLCNGEMLGKDQPIILNCLELPMAMDSLNGVAMELEDCAFPLLQELIATDDPRKAFDGCDIALMVGSKPRGPGMERGDLLKDNGGIFQKLGQTLNSVANKNCKVTVVGNPCNTNCFILANNAPDLKRANFTAMTRLDHDRAVSVLARYSQLPTSTINNVAIWGNHSATMMPDIKQALIAGVPVAEIIGTQRFERYWKHEFIPKVQTRGARIIEVRGSSSAASAANACIAHTRDWLCGTPQPDWTSMAVISNGEYGVDPGLVFSYPVWCKNGHYQVVSYPDAIDEFHQYQIERNVRELREERDIVSEYLPN